MDDIPISSEDKEILDNIMKKDLSTFEKFLSELKQPVLAGILFVIISTPQVSDFMLNTIPYARSSAVSLLCLKAFVFVVLLFLYNNSAFLMKK